MDLEKEIVELRGRIATVSADEARERAAADKLVADLRAAGVNPLIDKDAFEKVDAAYKRADGLRDELNELRDRAARALAIVGQKAGEHRETVEVREARTIADRLLQSEEYRALRESGRLESQRTRIDTAPVEVATRDEFIAGLRMRVVDNSAGSGGGLIWSDRKGIVVPIAERSVRLLDVITIGTTDSDTVEWAVETTNEHAAAETAYGVDAPEASYGWDKRSTTVRRIPHFIAATKGALADGGQLRTLLNTKLAKGVRLRHESQVLKGDGTGDNLEGILEYDILEQAVGTDSRFDAVHKALTKVRVAMEDNAASVIGLHPYDYERIVLEKDNDGNYSNRRGAVELSSIWGLTPVVSTLFDEGSPLVGDYSQAMLWVREGISLAMSDSHADFFRKGLVAIVAESRVAFAVLDANAFCVVTGFDGAGGGG